MTGKNVKERIGLGGMDADRIREIMGEAPACPRKRRGTSGNDIIRPARKNGPMQPSVYGEEYLHGIAGVQRRSLHIPAALHRKLSILAGASRNGKVTLEGFINHLVSRHLEEYRETIEHNLKVNNFPPDLFEYAKASNVVQKNNKIRRESTLAFRAESSDYDNR